MQYSVHQGYSLLSTVPMVFSLAIPGQIPPQSITLSSHSDCSEPSLFPDLPELALPLFPGFTEQLFLLVTEKEDRDYCGSDGHTIHHGWPRSTSPRVTSCILGRFASEWAWEPVVNKALLIEGFNREIDQWSNLPLSQFFQKVFPLWGYSSSPMLLVGQEEVLKKLQEIAMRLYQVPKHYATQALLTLPVSRDELSSYSVLLELLQIEKKETARRLEVVEEKHRQATKVFEDACDVIMLERRPLRDRERLHQAWLQANPEPEPVAESAIEPPAA